MVVTVIYRYSDERVKQLERSEIEHDIHTLGKTRDGKHEERKIVIAYMHHVASYDIPVIKSADGVLGVFHGRCDLGRPTHNKDFEYELWKPTKYTIDAE